ncbi:MAG TPA: HEAT repeat domain-containing protein, partial [Chitinophagaceae bacterium]
MAFYDLSKQERAGVAGDISNNILNELKTTHLQNIPVYFADDDTYIRKCAYVSIGRIYFENKNLQSRIIEVLNILLLQDDFKVRQTVINACGEIGKKEFNIVQNIFDKGLFDKHHSPRNAVIGSIKKMGEVNPQPVLKWARNYLHHTDKEIR